MIVFLKVCGLLGTLMVAVHSNPIMGGDIDTTMKSDDIGLTVNAQEIANASNTENNSNTVEMKEVVTSDSATTATDSTLVLSTERKNVASDITPAIAIMSDIFDKTTSSSSDGNTLTTTELAESISNSNSVMSDDDRMSEVAKTEGNPTTTITHAEPIPNSNSVMLDDDRVSEIAKTEGTPTTAVTHAETISNSVMADDRESEIAKTEGLPTMTVPLAVSMANSNSMSDDSGSEIAKTEEITEDVTMSTVLTSTNSVTREVKTTIPSVTDIIKVAGANIDETSVDTEVKIDDVSKTTELAITEPVGIFNLLEGIPTLANENSVIESHDEVDHVLSLSSNEDTTKIESSNALQNNDDQKEVPADKTDLPHVQESKPELDEKAKGNSNSIGVSFAMLFSMSLLYVIY